MDLYSPIKIDLSYNKLTGNVPISFTKMREFDLSYDSLEGRVPIILKNYGFEVFIGNKDLCSDITGFAQCPSPSLISPSTPPLAPENIVSRMEDGTEKDEHSNFKKKKIGSPHCFLYFFFIFLPFYNFLGIFSTLNVGSRILYFQ